MMTFLPADYKLPKAKNLYFRPEIGENKFRILSKPIEGWEDWENNKPKRFTLDNKPSSPISPDKPIRHFWAFIIWNYAEKEIQIYEITQASIKKQIKALSDDKDWGSPFFYDLKIIKKGSKKEDTEYLVNPLPHKPLSEDIISLFHDRPINLEALFTGEDPFSHLHDSYTQGMFALTGPKNDEIELKPISDVKQLDIARIDNGQLQELKDILPECSSEYKKKIWNFWKKQYGIDKLEDLPESAFESIREGILAHLKETCKGGK